MNGNGMGFFGGMGFTWILIIGILIIIVAIFINKQSNNNGQNNQNNNSLDTLKERLARGEITEAEYDRLKQKLDEK
ncbi:hypothetical protein GS400_10065 [Pontibacillus sp. HMF3514]|nr:hypothetical protein GS400_10065 [Pontibacillus sp. HMF3514]